MQGAFRDGVCDRERWHLNGAVRTPAPSCLAGERFLGLPDSTRSKEVGMAEDQRDARIFGVLFIITFVTSIAALALFQSVLDDPAGYIAGR